MALKSCTKVRINVNLRFFIVLVVDVMDVTLRLYTL